MLTVRSVEQVYALVQMAMRIWPMSGKSAEYSTSGLTAVI